MPLDLFDIVARHGIHFDQSRQVGVVFHMISSLTEHGRVGLTAVGDTAEDAEKQVPGRPADPARGGQIRVHRAAPPELTRVDLIWYVAYGSNLGTDRFRCYLTGGRPDGGTRTYAGCRDRSDPARDVQPRAPRRASLRRRVRRLGRRHGVLRSRRVESTVACRAYLLTAEQFADVSAQEMRRQPGGEFARALAAVLPEVGELHTMGPGRYETVVRLDTRVGVPLLTVTNGDIRGLTLAAPSAPYLRSIAVGLRDGNVKDISCFLSVSSPFIRVYWEKDHLSLLFVGIR